MIGMWSERSQVWDDGDYRSNERWPTHWQPLPAPPNTKPRLMALGFWLERASYQEWNFKARYRVIVSIPWFGGDRLGFLEDKQDDCFVVAKFGPDSHVTEV